MRCGVFEFFCFVSCLLDWLFGCVFDLCGGDGGGDDDVGMCGLDYCGRVCVCRM